VRLVSNSQMRTKKDLPKGKTRTLPETKKAFLGF
jgi:hypothetical protein